MSIRAFIYISVLLTVLCGKTGAQDLACTETETSQPQQPELHNLSPADKRKMCFCTRVSGYIFLTGLLIFEGDAEYGQSNTLNNQQQAIVNSVGFFSLAAMGIGILLFHF